MTHIIEDWKLQEMLAAAREEGRRETLGSAEPVGKAGYLAGSNKGFTTVVFKAEDVPYGTNLYTTPPRAMLMRVAEEAYNGGFGNGRLAGNRDGYLKTDLSAIVDRVMGELQ